MLIFTRRIGEDIRIGDDIRVRIIDIKGKQVRLGIEAPSHITIHREEIYQRINGQNAKVAESLPGDEVSKGDQGPQGPDNPS